MPDASTDTPDGLLKSAFEPMPYIEPTEFPAIVNTPTLSADASDRGAHAAVPLACVPRGQVDAV